MTNKKVCGGCEFFDMNKYRGFLDSDDGWCPKIGLPVGKNTSAIADEFHNYNCQHFQPREDKPRGKDE